MALHSAILNLTGYMKTAKIKYRKFAIVDVIPTVRLMFEDVPRSEILSKLHFIVSHVYAMVICGMMRFSKIETIKSIIQMFSPISLLS